MRIIISVCLFLAILAQPQTGRSETFHLRDGRIIEGELEHAYGGILTVVLPDGSRRSIGRNDLSEIRFGPAPDKTPAPSATPPVSAAKESPPGPGFLSPLKASDQRFNTPGATFETWRKAATEGDIDLMVEAYASSSQRALRKNLRGLKRNVFREMREATASTIFVPAEPLYQGDRAMLDVSWTKGLDSGNQVLHFVLEGNDWKIVQ